MTLDECKNKQLLRFDFCIPTKNIIIELDGAQHFIQVNYCKPLDTIQARDIYKMKCALEKGYKIIRIFQEDVYNNDKTWLDEILLPKINNSTIEPQYISKNQNLYNKHKELLASNA